MVMSSNNIFDGPEMSSAKRGKSHLTSAKWHEFKN